MRKGIFNVICLIMLCLLFQPLSAGAQNYVEPFRQGKIDWTNRIAEASGRGMPPSNPLNEAQARAVAEGKAISVARDNLFEIIKGIRIDGKTLIHDLVKDGGAFCDRLQVLLQEARIVDLSYREDGSVEATATLRLGGSFTDLVLPKQIRIINSVKPAGAVTDKGEDPLTGLVVDCRGLQVKAALVPRVTDEDGQVVYGPAYVSRDHALKMGMAGYVRELSAAQGSPRVSRKPLTVKAIRAAETGESDIVISNADAATIRGTASNLAFLQRGRVMIVLD